MASITYQVDESFNLWTASKRGQSGTRTYTKYKYIQKKITVR